MLFDNYTPFDGSVYDEPSSGNTNANSLAQGGNEDHNAQTSQTSGQSVLASVLRAQSPELRITFPPQEQSTVPPRGYIISPVGDLCVLQCVLPRPNDIELGSQSHDHFLLVLVDAHTINIIDERIDAVVMKIVATEQETPTDARNLSIVSFAVHRRGLRAEMTLAVLSSSSTASQDTLTVFLLSPDEQKCQLKHTYTFDKRADMDVGRIEVHENRAVVRYGEKIVMVDWVKGWVVKLVANDVHAVDEISSHWVNL